MLLTTDAVGGVWTYALELTGALRERGVEVTLAVLGAPPSEAPPGVDVRLVPGRLEWQEDPWEDVAEAGRLLLELEAELEPDVIHLNDYASGALAWRAPVLVVGHSCVLSWWEAVRGGEAPAEWERYRAAVRAGLHGADALIAPSAAMLAALRRLYGLGERGGVIPNGVRDRFEPAVKEPLVLAAGRVWDEAKGLDTLDEAAARIAWPVEVAGDAGEAPVRALRLLGRLERRDLRERMESAAIFAHPARYEPFGLAPLEAGLARCALVLGDVPALREVWEDAALFVPPGDAAALADAVGGLIADAGGRDEMAERARRRASRYSAAAMAEAYLREYTRIGAREALPA